MQIVITIRTEEPETPEKLEPTMRTPSRLDPIEELKHGETITVSYTARYQSSNVPFADFNRGDRRWINYLIEDLSRIAVASPTDAAIMQEYASVRARGNSRQTWQEFIDGLLADKVRAQMDFTVSQLKH